MIHPRWSLAMALAALGAIAAAGLSCSGRDGAPRQEVVVYTALDQIYSEPILKEFERQTGIRVLPVYDAEDSKTTGLVSRLIARRASPDGDVLWNNEAVQTVRLARMGLLAEYASPQARRIPEAFRDPDGRWTGFAARMRVIIYNTKLVAPADLPLGLSDFTAPKWRGRAVMARPFFGTTLTHVALLHQAWGPERLSQFLGKVRANGTALCPGNAAVRDLVAGGERAFGLTDTDDAYMAMQAGKPVGVVLPDAAGGVLIPNTVAIIAGCRHPDAAKRLVDYLLSPEVERRLARGPSAQIPLGTDLADEKTPWDGLRRGTMMKADLGRAAAAIGEVVDLCKQAGRDQ
jgi:iron(III) transport system substrate-binding protein